MMNSTQPYKNGHFSFTEDMSTNITDQTVANTSGQFLSKETLNLLDILLNCFFINTVSLLGIIGNIINIIVLLHHNAKTDTTTIFLLGLGISDLLFCICMPIRGIRCLAARFDLATAFTIDTMMAVYIRHFITLMVSNDTLLIGAIAIERVIAVYFPFKVSSIISPVRAKLVVCAIFLFNASWTVLLFNVYSYYWDHDENFNATVARLTLTDIARQIVSVITMTYFIVVTCIVWGIPWILVPICGVAICLKVVNAGKLRRQMSTSKDMGFDIKTVKMLLVLCSISFVLFSFPTVLHTIYYLGDHLKEFLKWRNILSNVIDCLYTINSSVNFLVYVCMSKKFADTIKKLF